jgi:hypothetical protein
MANYILSTLTFVLECTIRPIYVLTDQVLATNREKIPARNSTYAHA